MPQLLHDKDLTHIPIYNEIVFNLGLVANPAEKRANDSPQSVAPLASVCLYRPHIDATRVIYLPHSNNHQLTNSVRVILRLLDDVSARVENLLTIFLIRKINIIRLGGCSKQI